MKPVLKLPLLTLVLLLLAFVLPACTLTGFGPAEDHSSFISAQATDDGRSVIFTAQRLVYRPAAGWRAFPDGGIPYYSKDEDIVGVYDLADRKLRVIEKQKNTYWQPGQGEFHVTHSKGRIAVISVGGQKKSDYLTDVRHYLLDIRGGRLKQVPLRDDFAARGREMGYFYLLDEDGTMLLTALAAGTEHGRDARYEFWVRHPSGEYINLGSGLDYYGLENGELIFWSLDEHALFAYDMAARTRRALGRYIPATQEGSGLDARLSSPGGKTLKLWVKSDGEWRMKETLLKIVDIN